MKNIEIIPEIMLERYILNEVSEEEKSIIETALKENPETAKRIQKIKQSNTEILKDYTPEYFLNVLGNRTNSDTEIAKSRSHKLFSMKNYKIFAAFSTAVLIIFASLFFMLNPLGINPGETNIETTRIKGSKQKLFIYRKTDEGSQLLKSGDTASEGDIIQVAYYTRENKYGAIVSIDGNKNITLHYPAELSAKPSLKVNISVPLENSYQLDNAPDYEIFYFITSNKPINLNYIIQRIDITLKSTTDIGKTELRLGQSLNITKFQLIKR